MKENSATTSHRRVGAGARRGSHAESDTSECAVGEMAARLSQSHGGDGGLSVRPAALAAKQARDVVQVAALFTQIRGWCGHCAASGWRLPPGSRRWRARCARLLVGAGNLKKRQRRARLSHTHAVPRHARLSLNRSRSDLLSAASADITGSHPQGRAFPDVAARNNGPKVFEILS